MKRVRRAWVRETFIQSIHRLGRERHCTYNCCPGASPFAALWRCGKEKVSVKNNMHT